MIKDAQLDGSFCERLPVHLIEGDPNPSSLSTILLAAMDLGFRTRRRHSAGPRLQCVMILSGIIQPTKNQSQPQQRGVLVTVGGVFQYGWLPCITGGRAPGSVRLTFARGDVNKSDLPPLALLPPLKALGLLLWRRRGSQQHAMAVAGAKAVPEWDRLLFDHREKMGAIALDS